MECRRTLRGRFGRPRRGCDFLHNDAYSQLRKREFLKTVASRQVTDLALIFWSISCGVLARWFFLGCSEFLSFRFHFCLVQWVGRNPRLRNRIKLNAKTCQRTWLVALTIPRTENCFRLRLRQSALGNSAMLGRCLYFAFPSSFDIR